MKAVVLTGPGELKMTERAVPACGRHEVLVRVRACNLCKTDLKCLTMGQRDLVYPRVLGHEISGVIAEVGAAVTGYQKGQRVQVHPGIACGACAYCQEGYDNLCDHVRIMGFNYDGGFQEYLVVPEEGVRGQIINVIENDALSFEEISFIEPLSCCVNVQENLDLKPQDTLLIIGAGRMGILNLRVARALGVQKVFLVETDPRRAERAEKLGFDAVFEGYEAAEKALPALTEGQGVDAAIPCCAAPEAMNLALSVLRKRGRLGHFSGMITDGSAPPEINHIHYKEQTMVGAYGCGIAHSRRAKELLEDGSLVVKDLITERIPLEALEQGLEHVRQLETLSTIVVFD
ncbi:alcohol dehydrogenase catalytic domain-containing protein [Eubacterium sp. 1001713B170207_170306_E7]|uniref:alcohol dehydrogenase catalytic domain-containing protein n=1 Tax=Eubacterium sp. 1001713B170207_170306_E7 TaxID=2787097 RepID=UPI001898F7F3|nr:alcohol dehydrogenase catalytic domain-containing protein [Eubacterium sp. 1001713B170207_170306_E7]